VTRSPRVHERRPAGSSPALGTGPSCPHRPPCPGCPRFGEPGIGTGARETLARLAIQHALPASALISGATPGFRLRARLAIRGRPGTPKLGLFELGTHRIVPVPSCSVQHPQINRVAAVVRRALVDAGIAPYSDITHRGLARYLQVVIERASGSAQVVLVGNSATVEPLAGCLDLIRERLGDELHSLWFNSQCERTNTILGPRFDKWWGRDCVIEHFGGAAVHYPPGAFGQNNLDIAERIVEHLRAAIPDGARVAEFYAGVGAIGLSVLPGVREIHMNEMSPHSLDGLARGVAGLDATERAKVTVMAGPASDACAAAAGADVVIADPPRKGLDDALVAQLLAEPPARFLYVSCGLDSFVGDTARLTAPGRLRLRGLTSFNLMPFTEHVETVGRFERA
jgi:23S rRNA (uracil1939-C5)-methyltransferase